MCKKCYKANYFTTEYCKNTWMHPHTFLWEYSIMLFPLYRGIPGKETQMWTKAWQLSVGLLEMETEGDWGNLMGERLTSDIAIVNVNPVNGDWQVENMLKMAKMRWSKGWGMGGINDRSCSVLSFWPRSRSGFQLRPLQWGHRLSAHRPYQYLLFGGERKKNRDEVEMTYPSHFHEWIMNKDHF